MRRLAFAAWVLAIVASLSGIVRDVSATNNEVLIRPASPRPTVTPRPDPAVIEGLPQPSAAVSCPSGKAGFFAEVDGKCIYACTGGVKRLVAGAGCTIATPTATATPTPTAT
jgi:hypothetical protein